jgi:hypothetical protein
VVEGIEDVSANMAAARSASVAKREGNATHKYATLVAQREYDREYRLMVELHWTVKGAVQTYMSSWDTVKQCESRPVRWLDMAYSQRRISQKAHTSLVRPKGQDMLTVEYIGDLVNQHEARKRGLRAVSAVAATLITGREEAQLSI